VIRDLKVTGLIQPYKQDEDVELFSISHGWLFRGRLRAFFV
jgi:hypothetical protein